MQFQSALKGWAASNWFVLALPLLAAVSYLLTRTTVWREDGLIVEAVTLFDWCVTVPLLYALCYGRTQKATRLAVRMLALACLGVWIAARLVPSVEQVLLAELGWARAAGLAVLVLLELRLMFAVIRLAFSGTATAEQIAERSGAPRFIARLLLLEARFWRALWRLLRGR